MKIDMLRCDVKMENPIHYYWNEIFQIFQLTRS